MKGIGEGIAFCGFLAANCYLEYIDKPFALGWFIIFIWICASDWGQKQ